MPNETIGEIDCPFERGCKAEVRRYNAGKKLFYYACKHGHIKPNLPAGQEFMLKNARLYGPEGKPEPAPVAEPEKIEPPVAKPAEKPEAETPPPAESKKTEVPATPAKRKGGLFANVIRKK